jgi:cell division transport system permease protein
MARYGNQLTDIQYPKSLVTSLNERASKIGLIFLVVAIILCSIVIISIDNTIRLAMFSNRFLIKTMQMVGATRGFIIKPLTIKAIINGLVSSGIAITLVFIIVSWAESQFPQLKAIRNFQHDLLLYGGLILMGVGISVYSTHRSVLKYLKMKLDDLY